MDHFAGLDVSVDSLKALDPKGPIREADIDCATAAAPMGTMGKGGKLALGSGR